jgi:hypothetical protein
VGGAGGGGRARADGKAYVGPGFAYADWRRW